MDTFTLGDGDIFKELYAITKFFFKFTTYIKGYTTTGIYKTLWEILQAVKLFVLEYKSLAACNTAFTFNNNHKYKVTNI